VPKRPGSPDSGSDSAIAVPARTIGHTPTDKRRPLGPGNPDPATSVPIPTRQVRDAPRWPRLSAGWPTFRGLSCGTRVATIGR